MTIILIATAAGLSTMLGVWGYGLASADERIAVSAAPVTGRSKRGSDAFILNIIAERVGTPFGPLVARTLAPWRAAIRRRIDAAGRPGNLTFEGYARQTAGYVIIFGVLAVCLLAMGQVLLGIVCMLGALQNEFVLYGRMQSRQDDIERTMPDFLDVLTVTITAGLSFRVALARVAESMPGALADEFLVALRQMELGTSRREAFEDLRGRNRSEAVSQFVTALLQAEELGAPLSTALQDIGADLRRESAQWARRKAQRATPKITVVTTALTIPALMILVLGAMFYGSGVDAGGLFGN